MKTVLISGASGLIGKQLSKKLKEKGYEVRGLSREKSDEYYHWNPALGEINEMAFENLDTIIHLAGAPISKRWSVPYKVKLYDSRVESLEFLLNKAKKMNCEIKTLISASGVNYYGTETTNKIFTENDPKADDYLGNLCGEIEEVAESFNSIGTRVCIVRTSAVLSKEGGMLKELLPMAKASLLSPIGSGKQIVPWIHIDDIVNMYIHLLENEELSGAYNAVADEVVTNKKLTKKLTETLGRKILMPNAPAFVMRIIFGEMSTILLKGSAVSNEKIKKTGFKFHFSELKDALKDLLKKKKA